MPPNQPSYYTDNHTNRLPMSDLGIIHIGSFFDRTFIYVFTAHIHLESRKKGFITITVNLIYGFSTVYGQGVHEGIRK
jgi:hypothetical protein